MKLSETKGQHNGREWERDTAPAVPPTDGRSEGAKPQKGADFNQFFSARIGSRWVYINFEGRTGAGGWRKNGAFNGDMKHILTRRLTARYLLELCQTLWSGTLEP